MFERENVMERISRGNEERIIKGRCLKEKVSDRKKGGKKKWEKRFIFAEGETVKAAMTVRK